MDNTMPFPPAPPVTCPYPTAEWMQLREKRDLPAGVIAVFGPLAAKGEPFELTDTVQADHPPFARFISARASGCELRVYYELGGFGYGRATARLRYVDGQWRLLSRHWRELDGESRPN